MAPILRGWEGFIEVGDSLVHAFACHLVAVQAQNASPKTVQLYDGRHKQFLTFLQEHGDQPPFDTLSLNPANVRRASIWVRERSHGNRGGEAAARALVGTLKTTSAWLADEGFIEVDLLARVRRPRVSTAARTPFSQAEVRDLVAAAQDTYMASRDIAIIHLLLDTGIRVGGLCSVRCTDLDLRDRRVELRLKGGRRHALYFGTPDRRDGGRTVRALKRYLSERDALVDQHRANHQAGRDNDALFLGRDGWPLKEEGVRQMLERLGKATGIPHVIPHRFRHTFATMYLVRHPGDETGLRGILGHMSDDMYRVYAHLAHEIIAERAGRVALSEAWLGNEEDAGFVSNSPGRLNQSPRRRSANS